MLSVSDLCCAFGDKLILDHINLDITDGSFCAVMGPNGCGKTTLLRCIAGLLQPTHGSVEIDGVNVADIPVRQRAREMALVQQHPSKDIAFSAFDLVMMGRNPYQRRLENESQHDRDIVEECMNCTNTWHLKDSFPNQMSGGELQRVMIARALAQQTRILLLDEPTSNLDIAHQFEIMELLGNINRDEHKTILIVVHDLNLALHYCPDAILLHDKKTLFQGPVAEALTPDRILSAFGVRATNIDGFLRFEK